MKKTTEAQREDDDLSQVIGTQAGRRFVMRLLHAAHLLGSGVGKDATDTYYLAGRRHAGTALEAQLRDEHFDMWILMLQEDKREAEDNACKPRT